MQQNKEGHESKDAPDDLADGVKGSNVVFTKALDGAKGAEEVGGKPKAPWEPGKSGGKY